MSIAYIFPGQGSQHPGMGRNLVENFSVAARLFEELNDALHFSISRLCFEGTPEDLQLTENTQPAILAVSVAALRTMESEGFPQPDYVAGHSLGEYSALVAAKSLAATTAVTTVRARGRYMQEAVPVGTGAMAAVLGVELKDIERACVEASQGEVCAPANINSRGQVVIAGHAEAVERASELLRAAGAKRVLKLNGAPSHSALMKSAEERLAVDLERIAFNNLTVPLVTNVAAAIIRKGAEARESLVRQVSSPMRWLESIELLIQEGVDTFVEVGPGKVLTGLMRQISREVKCFNVEDAASLKSTAASLGI
ncbi:MAG TPA: ACP S-malonyltransferase [Pyrinomonadaceae bacterium]|jgi:[acyl-carrier-protein] S-malonyltransferase|nr:ACP S-malonyltransferase [Pyrinomonadaceae bacterium]